MSRSRAACACSSRGGGARPRDGGTALQHRSDLLYFRSGALRFSERHGGPVVPVARVDQVAFDAVQEPMDAKGELVAHAHDDRVGLVPLIPAQVRENPAMFVGRPSHGSAVEEIPRGIVNAAPRRWAIAASVVFAALSPI